MNSFLLKGRTFKFTAVRMSSTFTNHLANEKSPYLLRHKHNLVDWHPWGSEAFEKARSLNRPIFLSVGYSTCHWCYVMERESFENEEIAKILNDNFVSILVDREERPDVDMYYMNFVLTMVRSGGWPMSVFMDPNLVPFMGGSYFPPDDVRERKQVGFRSLLQIIINAWKDNPSLLPQQGKMLQQSMIFPHKVTKDATIPGSLELALKTIEKMYGRFDVTHGGIGGGPKFPQAPLFNMLNTMIAWMGPDSTDLKQKVAVMVDVTLEAMAKGGIRDHIDGGFHRYSVDGEWKIPHFEKMLYDQAQLLALYSDFSLMTDGKYNFILKEQLNYLNNILKHKEGGFYSAEDAVSLSTVDAKEEAEGAFYVWEYSEIEQGLDECEGFNGESAAEVFCKYFNINPEGNVERRYDERNELMKKNVLHMTMTHDEIAKSMNVCPKRLQEKIDGYKSVLGYIRGLRPRAYVDAKIIACYQGLLITGLAKAAKALNCSDTVKMAEECAEFCKKYFEKEEGSMIRCVYKTNNETIENSDSIVYGFSHDYSYLIQGLLDLYSVNGDESLLIRAKKLQNTMNEKLWDEKEKEWGYVLCEDAFSGQTDCFKEERDGAEPAATPIATMNLIRLGAIFDDDSYTEYARKIINGVGKVVALEIQICPTYAIPIMFMENRMTKVVVCGDEGNDLVKEFKNILNSQLLWNGVFIHINKNSKLIENSPVFNDMVKDEKPAVYICVGDSCGLPIHTAEDLKKKMAELSGNVELNDLDRSFLIEESN